MKLVSSQYRYFAKASLLLAFVIFFASGTTAFAWDLSTGSYDSKSVSVTAQEANPRSVALSSDGTKMYILGSLSDAVRQYTLSTPWDISTATYDSVSVSVSDASPAGLTFKPDGLRMYAAGATSDIILSYTLSSAWNLSSATRDTGVSFVVSAQDSGIQYIAFKSDGTKMYMVGSVNSKLFQYSLSSAWDISTLSYDSVSYTPQGTSPTGVFFKPDGSKAYIISNVSGLKLHQYSLATPWDVSTMSYDSVSFNPTSQDATPNGVWFKPDGAKLYIAGLVNDTVYQYSVTPPDATPPSVSVTAPAEGGTVSGSSVSITASASDTDSSVAGVKFYVNGILQGSEDTSSPYAITWNSTATSSGTKRIQAVARDTAGNVATSTTVTVTVDNTPTPSSVSVSPLTTSGTITWTTARTGSSRVYLGISSVLASSTPETNTGGSETTSHSVALSGLVSCSTYSYLVTSRSPNGIDTATSSTSTFSTTGCTGDAAIASSTQEEILASGGGSVVHDSLTLTIPASFTATSSEVSFQVNTIDATSFAASAGTPSGKSRAGAVYALQAVIDEADTLSSFAQALTITLTYTDSDIVGLDESLLTIYRYDGTSWSALSSCSTDAAANTITCTTTQFSYFGIYGSAPSSEDSSAVILAGTLPWCSGPLAPGWTRGIAGGGCLAMQTTLADVGSFDFQRNLRVGMKGDDVHALQSFLNALGFRLALTGPGSPGNETSMFGALTYAAILKFQETHALHVLSPISLTKGTGYFGPLTRTFMNGLRGQTAM